jgi:hypothetical protein
LLGRPKEKEQGIGFGFVKTVCKTAITTKNCLACQQQSKVLDQNASVHEIAS